MPHRGLVARLAWLLSLLSLATSVVHMGVVRHDRCLEHGELVEVRGAPADQEPDTAAAIFVASASEQHDEHCPLASVGPPARTTVERAHAAYPSVDALDVAPKQGPPKLAV